LEPIGPGGEAREGLESVDCVEKLIEYWNAAHPRKLYYPLDVVYEFLL
jgi:hypothetical protein